MEAEASRSCSCVSMESWFPDLLEAPTVQVQEFLLLH